MAWNSTLTLLRDVLADLYFTARDARRVVEQAGLDPKYIDFSGEAITFWHDILRDAERRRRVPAIVAVARQDYPDNPILDLADQGALTPVLGPDIKTAVHWQADADFAALEKIIGAQSTLLPISFLEVGLQAARAVVRVVRSDGATGSGFLTSGNLLVTNHHVLAAREEADGARIQFNYQKTAAGLDAPLEEAALAPQEAFVTSADDDWTAVRVQGTPNAVWGALPLVRATPQRDDFVTIIQHPGGGPKQIALYHNVVVYADARRVQYLTDTLPGSSGSPVFDTAWRVVALHHSGGWLREPGSKQTYYRNEGIHAGVVIDGLMAAGLLAG
jgi:hypothetical protein